MLTVKSISVIIFEYLYTELRTFQVIVHELKGPPRHKGGIVSVPNLLGYVRMLAVLPVWFLVVYTESRWLALGIFAGAALTDFLDGHLARRNGKESVYGGFLDLVADKILIVGVLFSLAEVGRVPAWAGGAIASREIFIMSFRNTAATRGVDVQSTRSSKLKMWIQSFAIGSAIVEPDIRIGPWLLDEWLILVAVIHTLSTGIELYARNHHEVETAEHART